MKVQIRGGDQRSRHRAGVIHRAMKTIDEPAAIGRREACEHDVARRRPDALAKTIAEPQREHLDPVRGQRDERPESGGQAVTAEHQPLRLAPAIRHPARDDFQQAVGRFRDAFNHAERHRSRSQRPRQEQRKERIDHLACCVGEEADPAEHPDGTREAFR
jgi:hypothetical protein